MISRFDELKLIARCLTTDSRSAYSELVAEYEEGLRRFLLNLTLGDAMLTDDLAQETFIKAYLSLRSFKGVSRFSTWLYRIAYNEYIGYRRKYSREESEIPDNIPEESAETYRHTDIRYDLAKAMSALNENERAAVTLFYLQEMPINKVADILGMKEGTLKSNLSRARKKMKEYLED